MVIQLSTIALIDINKLKTTLMAAFFKNVLLKCLHITINLQKIKYCLLTGYMVLSIRGDEDVFKDC